MHVILCPKSKWVAKTIRLLVVLRREFFLRLAAYEKSMAKRNKIAPKMFNLSFDDHNYKTVNAKNRMQDYFTARSWC